MNYIVVTTASYILFNISYVFLLLFCIQTNYRIKKLEKLLQDKEEKGKHVKLFEGDNK